MNFETFFIIHTNIRLNKFADTIFLLLEKHLIIIVNVGNFNCLFDDILSSVLTPILT